MCREKGKYTKATKSMHEMPFLTASSRNLHVAALLCRETVLFNPAKINLRGTVLNVKTKSGPTHYHRQKVIERFTDCSIEVPMCLEQNQHN